MKNWRLSDLLLSFVIVSSALLSINAEPQLKLLNIVFRHGERTPDRDEYPTDPYKDFNYPPEGNGELSNIGERREYALGNELRKMYDDFIGDTYSPSIVNARTTDLDRIQMSLQLVMAGLFKPKKKQIWNHELAWQPTVIHSVPGFLDILMSPQECPQYLDEFSSVQKLPEVEAKLDNLSGFMKNLSDWTGKNITSLNDIYRIYHALSLENALNLPLPKWSKGIFPHGLLWNGTIQYYETVSYNTKLKRLNGGMLLRNITESMFDAIHNKTNDKKKINLFSGNERNLAAFLNTLGLYTPHVPQFSCAVIVELLGDSKGHYVRIRYYRGIPPQTITMKIPGCNELCPFEKFCKLMKPVIPSNKEIMCQKEPLSSLLQKIYDKFSRI